MIDDLEFEDSKNAEFQRRMIWSVFSAGKSVKNHSKRHCITRFQPKFIMSFVTFQSF